MKQQAVLQSQTLASAEQWAEVTHVFHALDRDRTGTLSNKVHSVVSRLTDGRVTLLAPVYGHKGMLSPWTLEASPEEKREERHHKRIDRPII